tara:strand:+ start:2155 stop:2853 length:699 start_codon:yes stop_codon:yes gene_type:complete
MKIALCLQGLSSGRNDKGDPVGHLKGFKTIKENILDLNDVDVFIHSWSESDSHNEEIKNLYSPIDSVFEKQIFFPYSGKGFLPAPHHENEYNPERKYHYISSRWYSQRESLGLKKRHEEKEKFEYDLVMVSRFDVCYFTPFIFKEYSPEYFYASDDFGDPSTGFNDVWFIGSSPNMDKYATVFDNIDDYTKKDQTLSSHVIARTHAVSVGLEDKIRYTKKLPTDYQLSRRVP